MAAFLYDVRTVTFSGVTWVGAGGSGSEPKIISFTPITVQPSRALIICLSLLE
ncbi:MAG TPA: hypothetical protein VN674_08250 [Gemmatimonadales bacterium]|nr:hypothetical protein [Gemmatimonadales bacterium]